MYLLVVHRSCPIVTAVTLSTLAAAYFVLASESMLAPTLASPLLSPGVSGRSRRLPSPAPDPRRSPAPPRASSPARSPTTATPRSSTAASTTPSGRRVQPYSRLHPAGSRRGRAGHREDRGAACWSASGTSTSASSASTATRRGSSCRRRRRDASLSETDSVMMVLDTFNDNQNAFVFGTNPLGIEYDGQVAREGQTSGISVRRRRRRRRRDSAAASAPSTRTGTATGRSRRRSPIAAGKPRWPSRSRRCATRPASDQTWGFNVLRNIRHKNEQVYLAADPARLRHLPRVAGGEAHRARPAAAARHQADSVRARVRRTRTSRAAARPGRQQGRRRRRRQVGNPAEPHAGPDGQHRLRAGRSRRGAGEPHALRPVLPGEAAVLPRERVDVPVRPAAVRSTCSSRRRIGLSATGAADRHPRRRAAERQGRAAGTSACSTSRPTTPRTSSGTRIAPDNNFSRRSRVSARSAARATAPSSSAAQPPAIALANLTDWNRAYGVDANCQLSQNQRVSAFLARTDTPEDAGRRACAAATTPAAASTTSPTTCGRSPAATRRSASASTPRSASCRAAATAAPSSGPSSQPQPKGIPWIRRISPHVQLQRVLRLRRRAADRR